MTLPDKLNWVNCNCGSPHCKLRHPTNLGSFFQGNGFEPAEAAHIDRAFGALRAVEAVTAGALPTSLSIAAYCHCGKCLEERPDGVSPQEWAMLEVGFTVQGLQVWCKRHQLNVMHIDFEGHRHPANMAASSEKVGG